ncbi:hypothetical protein [Longivirga aurantiaca]|uniref:Lipoprotein n=1 Tax=Longivirga aurantiaca TaxID=1837743 RepID=A0ABW1T357_9ACTN
MRTLMRAVAVTAVLALAAACGSSGSGTPTSSQAPEPTYSAVVLNCDQYPVRATNLYSHASKSGLNIGTTNSIDGYVTQMQEALADLELNAPECAPAATEELAALGDAITAYAEAYEPTAEAADANNAALLALAAQGRLTWTAMGLDPAQWDGV